MINKIRLSFEKKQKKYFYLIYIEFALLFALMALGMIFNSNVMAIILGAYGFLFVVSFFVLISYSSSARYRLYKKTFTIAEKRQLNYFKIFCNFIIEGKKPEAIDFLEKHIENDMFKSIGIGMLAAFSLVENKEEGVNLLTQMYRSYENKL